MHSAWMIPAVLSLALAAPRAQGGSDPKVGAEPKKGDALVVTGCIAGQTIEETDTLRTYRLTGDKAVVKELTKEHAGHLDEVSGTLKSTLTGTSATGTQAGRTRITIGVVETRSDPQRPDRGPSLPVLAVKSFRHLPGACTK
jgi:hypothetical protein